MAGNENQNHKMRWVLFWTFLVIFFAASVLTLMGAFFGKNTSIWGGELDQDTIDTFQKAFIGEVAVAVVVLFYSLFGLKKPGTGNASGDGADTKKLQKEKEALEQKLKELESESQKPQSAKVGGLSASFDTVLEEIESFLGPNGFPETWSIEPNANSVKWEYIYNIGIQKLLCAASRINDHRDPANFWVCGKTGQDQSPQFLWSEQREGNFDIGQMLVRTPNGVSFRGGLINYQTHDSNSLPLSASSVRAGECVLMPLAAQDSFDNSKEIKRGITHILGIPALSGPPGVRFHYEQPMSITVDMRDEELDMNRVRERGKKLATYLHKLYDFWLQNQVREGAIVLDD